MSRKLSPFTLVVALLAIAAVVAAFVVVGSDTPTSVASERTVAVTDGVIQATVSGSGSLAPRRQFSLDFGASGKVTAIYVKAGDHVAKGDLLAVLDKSSAQVDLAKAQADLVDARDQLDQAVTAAAAAASSSSSTSDASASTATTAATSGDGSSSGGSTGSASSGNGSSKGSDSSGGSGSNAGSDSSGSGGSGSSGSGGSGSSVSVESAQAQVASAELAVKSAEEALASTRLEAPAAGTIASVSGEVGDSVSAGGSSSGSDSSSGSGSSSGNSGSSSSSGFIELVDVHKLSLEVSLSESDIGKVKVGQPATVSVNAVASGEQVSATVTAVSVLPASSDSSGGAVSYPVTLTLDQTTRGIRTGMSASADIVVSEVSGMSVPNQALQGSTVTIERGGRRSTQRVQTGVVGDSATQIVSGLEKGDKVVVTSTSAAAGANAGQGGATSSSEQSRFGGRGPGGGGFGGGGGGGPVFKGPPGGKGP